MKSFESMGERIWIRRQILGLSQNAVALRSQSDKNQIHQYEKGLFFPNSFNLRKLAQALECSSDYLLGLKNKP